MKCPVKCSKAFFSFDQFITPTIITILFWISVVINGLVALVVFISMIQQMGFWGFFVGLIAGGLYFMITVIFTKVFYEIIVVLFKINENLQAICEQKKND